MVIIVAIEIFNVQAHTAIASERLEKLFEQLSVHVANLVAIEADIPDEIGSLTKIDSGPAQRLVHWQIGVAVAGNTSKITERLFDRLANDNASIFNSMVTINVQITVRFYGQIDERMAPQRVQHMVEKANAGRNIRLASAVQIYGHRDIGFFCLARDCSGSVSHASPDKVYFVYRLAQICSRLPKQLPSQQSVRVVSGIKAVALKPIRAISRSLGRTSFATVLTLASSSLGLILSGVFTVFYFSQAWTAYQVSAHENGLQVAQLVTEDLAHGNTIAIETAMQYSLADRALILDPMGEPMLGDLSVEMNLRAAEFPLIHDGEVLGTLVYAPSFAFKPPLPIWAAILLCVVVSIIAALVMRAFARTVVDYVGQVTRLIGDYSLVGTSRRKVSKFAFAEFRQLALATTRATRRVGKELDHLRTTARIDERTGLLNEPAFHQDVKDTIQALPSSAQAVLITIEFQAQNANPDAPNHSLTNEAYIEAANRLRIFAEQAVRKHGYQPSDWVLGSLFSDQFALLIKANASRDDVAGVIRELLGEFRIPLTCPQHAVPVVLNGSIVLIPQDGDSLTKILERAQATLEDLKSKSRSGFAFYTPKLERQRDAKIKLETELRQAVSEDRFVPLFQPKIDLKTGRISGCEALARWQLENGRLVSPSVFIELAEECGLIGKVGAQILYKASNEAAKWAREGYPINLAVNVSPRQFEDENLSETILDALAKSGLSPRQLEIEITESLAIQQPDRVRDVLEPLRRLGIKLAMDDFGTGHSNLAVLTQIDFDVFKIDRQFLTGTPHDEQSNAIVDMILSMANTLNMTIVGEGIETEEQAAFLTNRDCDIGQGFLYSPPVSAEAFEEMLKTQPFMVNKMSA